MQRNPTGVRETKELAWILRCAGAQPPDGGVVLREWGSLGRTIDDLGPVLADEGGRGLNLVYGLYRGVRLPEDEAALTV